MQPNPRGIFATALVVVVPMLSSAQDAPRPRSDPPPATDTSMPAPRTFEELDANGDGSIANDEAAVDPALMRAFGSLDQDADGKLSPAEYGAYRPTGGRTER